MPDVPSRVEDPETHEVVFWSPPIVLHRGIAHILWYCPACHFNCPDHDEPMFRLDAARRDICD
eukprot:6670949-Lingulodinium_polyedra.AAC.1